VVSALPHGGSGKTLVGEYAIHRALGHGQKVFLHHGAEGPLPTRNLRRFREQVRVCRFKSALMNR